MEDAQTNQEIILESFINQISIVSDFRDAEKIRYSLNEIILLVFAASLCDCRTYNEISDFGKYRIDWFRRYLPYQNGIPSHDTVNRVLSLIDPKELEMLLLNWSMKDITLADGAVLSIDGKYLNKSVTAQEQQTKVSKGGKQVLGTLNLYSASLEMCLASVGIDGRSSERKGASKLLDLLDISNCTLTLDAGFCHHEVIDKIRLKSGHYLVGVKNNQKRLCTTVKQLFELEGHSENIYKQTEKDHGRIEIRECEVISVEQLSSISKDYQEIINPWKDLKTLIKVDSVRHILRTDKKSKQTRYYISSREMESKEASKLIRQHWAIENNLHWVLDVTFGEDSSTKRRSNAALNYSIFLKMALNHLKKVEDKGVSIKRKIKKCMLSAEYLEKTIFS